MLVKSLVPANISAAIRCGSVLENRSRFTLRTWSRQTLSPQMSPSLLQYYVYRLREKIRKCSKEYLKVEQIFEYSKIKKTEWAIDNSKEFARRIESGLKPD